MDNKYTRWYSAIIERGKLRESSSEYESHHILPKCLGGGDDPTNRTNVTTREHFICHWLLTKIHYGSDRYKVLNAMRMMRAENPHQKRYSTKITSRVYAKLKAEWAQLQSEKMRGDGNPMYGRKVSDEVKLGRSERAKGNNPARRPGVGAKISAAKTGKSRKPFSEEWRANLGKNHKSKNGTYDCSIKEETKKKIGDKLRGRKQTQEEKDRRGASVKALGLKREKLLCPHCNQMIAVNGYARWHGDKCKMKGSL